MVNDVGGGGWRGRGENSTSGKAPALPRAWRLSTPIDVGVLDQDVVNGAVRQANRGEGWPRADGLTERGHQLIVGTDNRDLSQEESRNRGRSEDLPDLVVSACYATGLHHGHRKDEPPFLGVAIVEPKRRTDLERFPVESGRQLFAGLNQVAYQLCCSHASTPPVGSAIAL